jgi:hypothetical protein
MRKNRLMYIAVFFLISLLVGFDFKCNDNEKDPIKLYVTCTAPVSVDPPNTSFTGNYFYNSNFGGFSNTNNSGSTYYYSIIFDDLDTLIVNASITRDSGDTTSYTLSIFIFKDETMVEQKTINSTSSGTDMITNFIYNYGTTY